MCAEFPDCGGCMYQTMAYEDQLAMKARQVQDLIEEALVKGGQVKEGTEKKRIICLRGFRGVLWNLVIEIRWNFPLAMRSREVR